MRLLLLAVLHKLGVGGKQATHIDRSNRLHISVVELNGNRTVRLHFLNNCRILPSILPESHHLVPKVVEWGGRNNTTSWRQGTFRARVVSGALSPPAAPPCVRLQPRRVHLDPLVVPPVPPGEVHQHLCSLVVHLEHLCFPPLLSHVVFRLEPRPLMEHVGGPPPGRAGCRHISCLLSLHSFPQEGMQLKNGVNGVANKNFKNDE